MTDDESERVAKLEAEVERLTAENRLAHLLLITPRQPGRCGRVTNHKPHRWLPSRTALDCPGLGPDAAPVAQDAPAAAYEFGFENMDRGGEGPMMIGRPEADVRAVMAMHAERAPEVHYALRRRLVGPWVTVEDTDDD